MPILANGKLTRFGKVGVLLLAVYGLMLVVPDFARVWAPSGALGFSVDNDARIVDVDPDARVVPPLRVGQRVDVAKTDLLDRMVIFADGGGLQYVPLGRPYRFFVRDRGREVEETVLPAAASLPADDKIALFGDQLFAVAFILIALALVWLRPSAATFGFFLFMLWYNPGELYGFYFLLERWPQAVIGQELVEAALKAVGCAGFAVFALRFPDVEPRGWGRTLERLLPAVVAYLFIVQVVVFATVFGLRTEHLTSVFYVSTYLFDLVVVAILVARLRSLDATDRQRLRWVMWGCMIGLPAFIFADSNVSSSLWDPLYSRLGWSGPSEAFTDYCFMVSAVIPLAVAHAVLRYRVIDVRIVLRRTIARAIVWIVVGCILVQAILLIEDPVRRQMQPVLFALLFIAVSLLFEWLHERIHDRLDVLIFPHLHLAADRLERAGAALRDLSTDQEIVDALVAEPAEALRLASAMILVRDDQGGFRRAGPGIGWPADRKFEMHGAAAWVDELERECSPMRFGPGQFDGYGSPGDAAQPTVAIPIVVQRRLVAVALYGAHLEGDDLDKREVDALEKLCLTASISFEHREIANLKAENASLKAKLAGAAG